MKLRVSRGTLSRELSMIESILSAIVGFAISIAIAIGGVFGVTHTTDDLVETARKSSAVSTTTITANILAPAATATPPRVSKIPPPTPAPVQVAPIPTKPTVSNPGPLRATSTGVHTLSQGTLTAEHIIILTNREREKFGRVALSQNTQLTEIAKEKAKDMIAGQYFDHVSPAGVTLGDLAVRFKYAYRHIGENLALGDFASSSHVVDGWMNSQGHRENILMPDFTEIGVAVMRGLWEGREVWWAVQEFGRPMPSCTEPDQFTLQKIQIFDDQLDRLRVTISRAKEEIENPALSREEYLSRVSDYNLLVDLFNSLLGQQKALIAEFNSQVTSYNACIEE